MRILLPALSCLAFVSLSPAAADKKPAAKIPDYSVTPRTEVPDQFKFRLTDLFADEAAWQKEFDEVKAQLGGVPALAKDWTASPKAMADMMDLLAKIEERLNRLHAYAQLNNDMDLGNPDSTRMRGAVQTLAVDFGSKSTFLGPDVLALGAEKVEGFLKAEPRLAPHRFTLEKTLRARDHILPEAEANIVAATELYADTASKAAGLLRNVDMPNPEITLSDGTKVVLNESNFLKYRITKNTDDRRLVIETFWKNYKKFENTYAALLDGEMKKQFALAKISHFPDCLEAALFEDDIKPEVYTNLIQTVRANLAPMHRSFRLKRKMLGLDKLHYYDLPVPAAPVEEKLYDYDECRTLVRAAVAPLGGEYAETLNGAFDNHWIDWYPNKGKQSGAYSMGVFGVHPFVKMNYIGRYADVSTVAHELGHSMHSYFSNKNQPFPTAQYTIFTAEIASTFNENLLINEVLKSNADDARKLSLLESYLDQMRGTIYAQTMFAEFELAMHRQVEKGQALTAEWLDKTYFDLYRTYMGVDQGVLEADDTVAVSWAAVPHFYRRYYVFQYVTGMVASSALSEAVLHEGEPAAKRYLGMLKAGGSKFPLDLLREAGVDLTKPEPIIAATRQYDRLVGEMEAIYARLPEGKKK